MGRKRTAKEREASSIRRYARRMTAKAHPDTYRMFIEEETKRRSKEEK